MGIQGRLNERLFLGDATDGQCMFVKLADCNYNLCLLSFFAAQHWTIGFPGLSFYLGAVLGSENQA